MPLFKASVYQFHAGVWYLCQTFGETSAPDQRPSQPAVEHSAAEGAAELAVDRAINLEAIKVKGNGSVLVRILLRPIVKPGERAPFDLLIHDTYVGMRREQLAFVPATAAQRDMKIMSAAFKPDPASMTHLLSADGSGEAWCGAWIADEQAREAHPVGGTPEAVTLLTCPKCMVQRLVHLEERAMVGRYLDILRSKGWSVAVHNDYKLEGKPHTFWLFTKGETAWKGEGRTDLEALQQIVDRLPGEMAPPPAHYSAFAAEVVANGRLAKHVEALIGERPNDSPAPPIDAAPQHLEAPPPWAGIHVLDSKAAWLGIVADAKIRAEANARAAGEQVTEEHEASGLAEALRVGIEKTATTTKARTVGHPILKRLDDLIGAMRWERQNGMRMYTEAVIDAFATVSARLDRIESTLRIRGS